MCRWLNSPGSAQVEVGTHTYDWTVSELEGEAGDRVLEEQARRYPDVAEYAEKTAGTRTIPVLALPRT